MTVDLPIAVGGLLVGIVVGLTGMGGGALMTPMLVFFAGVQPLTAISSDIVVSLFMKPSAAIVHLRRGTVHLGLVGWLCVGSVPAAFSGAWVISQMPAGEQLDETLRILLGTALLVATAGLVIRALLQMWRNRLPLGEGPAGTVQKPAVVVRPLPTVIIGAVAGFMVGVTSVGAGSIIIVALLFMHPRLRASSLVGTDLAQAIPLVAAAAVGHLLYGSFSLVIAASLLIGAVPGAWIGAQLSSRAPGGLIRRLLLILLLSSGLRLVGVPTPLVFAAVIATIVLSGITWGVIRRRVKAGAARRSSEARAPADSTDADHPAADLPAA